MAYQTYLTTKPTLQVTQGRHPANDAVDIQIKPRGANDNDLRAIIDGEIIHAGHGEDWTYGISVTISGTGDFAGYFVRYAHLASVSVSGGLQVSRGKFLGFEGTTGRVSGPHVHLEILYNGVPVSNATFQQIVGFPITPGGILEVEFGGENPDPPDPPIPTHKRRRMLIYSRRSDYRHGKRN